ncbi:hypothetical protein ACO3VM_02375 [Methanocaldococcus sp. 10A]
MLVIDGDNQPNNFIAFVITGDGRWEQVILKSIAKRYNGKDKIIYFPKSPFKKSKKIGLSCLDFLKLEKEKLNIFNKCKNLVVLIDKEHVQNNEDVINRLNYLNVFDKIEINKNSENLIIVEGKLKNKNNILKIYVVIFGKYKCIEENVAELIKLEFGKDINPNKNSIKDFLKSHNLKRKHLIEISKLENLEASFNNLIHVIKELESGD